jgi:hypothetical protein
LGFPRQRGGNPRLAGLTWVRRGSLARIEPTPSSGEDPRPRWQTAWYLPGRRGPRPLRGAGNGPGAVSCCPASSVRGGPRHEPLTTDRRPSAVLTDVLAGRTRHRKRRTRGATLTRSATRPRVAAAVGASTRLVAQVLRPSNPTTTSRATIPSSQPGHHPRPWPCWRMRGRVTTCRSHPWWIAQRRAGLYRESWAVQPFSAQVRVSPKARTIGPAPTARRLPVRLNTTMLGLFPHPSRANAARPRHTRRSGSMWSLGVG